VRDGLVLDLEATRAGTRWIPGLILFGSLGHKNIALKISVRGRLGAGPTANLPMRRRAVMAGDAIGVERSVLDRLDDRLLIDLDPHPFYAIGRSLRQTVRKNNRFHGKTHTKSPLKKQQEMMCIFARRAYPRSWIHYGFAGKA
jgi:hypothetical protein